ncbi:hypothetical protein FDUTEX481_03826 [Tolypothrix sp. PCC 7601]|nr:hypothetical protein FDUTEX481_03826 [Tolypothrix sp. PCC 7601]
MSSLKCCNKDEFYPHGSCLSQGETLRVACFPVGVQVGKPQGRTALFICVYLRLIFSILV